MQVEKNHIYELVINEDIDGVYAVSLVDEPAIEKDFVYFSKVKQIDNKEIIEFQSINEEKREVVGVLLIPNQQIFRRDKNGIDYYVYMSEETVYETQKKFFRDKNQSNTTIQHNLMAEGNYIFESYITETEKDTKAIKYGYTDLPKGSWIVKMKIDNDETWDLIKNKEIKGFSIEGLYDLNKTNKIKNKMSKTKNKNSKLNSMFKKFVELFKEELKFEYVSVETEEGLLELYVNVEESKVYVIKDEEITSEFAPQGEHTLEDGRTLVVGDNGEFISVSEKDLSEVEMEDKEEKKEEAEMEEDKLEPIEVAKLEDGTEVKIFEHDGQMVAMIGEGFAPAGEHKFEDGSIIEVAEEGIIIATTPSEEVVMKEDDKKEKTDYSAVLKELKSLRTEVAELKKVNAKLSKLPADSKIDLSKVTPSKPLEKWELMLHNLQNNKK